MHSSHPWKIWNAYGPSGRDGLLRAARIGPDGKGGIVGSEGYDLVASEADLLLIAAAPELLEALIEIQREVDMSNAAYRRAWKIAEAAIAKTEVQETHDTL